LIKRFFQGLSVAFKTIRIVKELMEIWLNEVCDKKKVERRIDEDNTLKSKMA